MPFCDLLNKIVSHFNNGAHAHFLYFFLTFLTLTINLSSEGGRDWIAPLFMMQTIISSNWDIEGFAQDYRILLFTLNEKIELPRFDNFLDFTRIRFFEFWLFYILHFCKYFCSQARYLSFQYLNFLWMDASISLNFIMYWKHQNKIWRSLEDQSRLFFHDILDI